MCRDGDPGGGKGSLFVSLNAAAISPDGKRIVTASADKTARLWEADTGEQIGLPFTGHTGIVTSAAFNSDGRPLRDLKGLGSRQPGPSAGRTRPNSIG
jgi:WD40 repeat protein